MNDHNILQCAIHMVHGWSLPPNTCKRETVKYHGELNEMISMKN